MRKITILLAFIFCASLVSFAQQDSAKKMDPETAKYYNKGIESVKASKFEDAVVYFDSCMLKMQDPRFNMQKAFCFSKMKKYPEALKEYQEVIKQNPKNDAAYSNIARVYYEMKKYDDCIAANKKIIEVFPEKKAEIESQIAGIQSEIAIDFYNKGIELYKQDKGEDALAAYQKSLDIKKDHKVYYQMGLTYQKMKKPAEAIKMLEQCIALNDSFALAYNAIAGIHYTNKDYTAAIASYEKTIAVAKNETIKTAAKNGANSSYFAMGSELFKEKKYDKALECFTKANELTESDNTQLFIARCYAEKKQIEAANAAFDKTLQIKKTVSEGQVAYYRGMMYMAKNNYAKASECFVIASKDEKFKKFSDAQLDYIKKVQEQDKNKKK
ncbi:MAG: tetratricopeptide repeat protein [Ignavibacteria bacterium]|nr:tetratricopeptide repeat protein [Ignavibacteria bacterium]